MGLHGCPHGLMTDMQGSFPLGDPDYPCAWVLHGFCMGWTMRPHSSSAPTHCTSDGRNSGVRMPVAVTLLDRRRYFTAVKPAVSSIALTRFWPSSVTMPCLMHNSLSDRRP